MSKSIPQKTIREVRLPKPTYNFKISRDGVRAQHYILLLLWRLGPLRSHFIYDYMVRAGYNVKSLADLHSRMYYLRHAGLIERDEFGRYRITELGEKYAKELIEVYKVYANESENIKNTLKTIGFFTDIEELYDEYNRKIEQKLSQIMKVITKFMKLSSEEKELMEYILRSHLTYGTTYTYADIIAEDLRYNPIELKKLLKRLQAKGLVYMFENKRYGVRIGLGKKLKMLLQTLESSSSYTSSTVNLADAIRTIFNLPIIPSPRRPPPR